ncbi:AzlC family ABC transporter permease [Marinomonas epiphytica]
MKANSSNTTKAPLLQGIIDAIPLLGGYIPVAISFGLISTQAGFSLLEVILISTFVYAGASQFLFVAMVAGGAPLWLVILVTLLINARHMVYGPNIAPYLSNHKAWPWLMHGLTDQVFALAHHRLPSVLAEQRMSWYIGAAGLAWFSWIIGSGLGAVVGEELTSRWPIMAEVMHFALPALFLVLVLPKCQDLKWTSTIGTSVVIALLVKVMGQGNWAIPLAAISGACCYYALSRSLPPEENKA